MITIKQLVNKIFWDVNEKKEDYVLLIYDRIEKKLKSIEFSKIEKIEGNFLKIKNNNEFVYIPMHRIKIVLKNKKVFWKRSGYNI